MLPRSETRPAPPEDLPEDRDREAAVFRRLEEAARPSGVLRFDQFVDLALYADAIGFYTHPAVAFGPRGAFYTAPEVSDLFGATLAHRIAGEVENLRDPWSFTIVEVGAGDGKLAAQILGQLPALLPRELPVRYVIADRSSVLRERTLDRIRAMALPSGWEVEGLGTIGELGPFRGVLLAHELLDALPFRRWIRRAGDWHELGVRVANGQCVPEELRGPSSRPGPLPEADEGAIFDVAAPQAAFAREVGDHLVEGAAIVIDFGAQEDELLRSRSSGTLEGLRGHRPSNPLAHPGLTDLSTFVNFTRFRDAAARSGLAIRSDRSQAEALVAWGIEGRQAEALGRATSAEAAVRVRLAVKNLLYGFSNFRALEIGPARKARAPPSPSAR